MKSLWPKIRKLLAALKQRDEIYLVNRRMVYSEKLGRTCGLLELHRLTPAEEYYEAHPRAKKKECEFVQEKVDSSFKEVDILLKLVSIYKGGDG